MVHQRATFFGLVRVFAKGRDPAPNPSRLISKQNGLLGRTLLNWAKGYTFSFSSIFLPIGEGLRPQPPAFHFTAKQTAWENVVKVSKELDIFISVRAFANRGGGANLAARDPCEATFEIRPPKSAPA